MTTSDNSSIARETARDDDGKFGTQAQSEPEGGNANATMGFTLPEATLKSDILILPSGEEVTLDHKPEDFLGQSVTTHSDGGVTVSYLVHDDDPSPVFDEEESPLKEFRTQWDRDAYIEQKTAEVGAERVFVVDKYDHSGTHFSIKDTANYPDRQFDVAPSNVLVVPKDVEIEHARAFAESTLNVMNEFNAGDVYGVVTQTWDAHGTELESDACWGYIGDEYAKSTRDDEHKSSVKHYDENLSLPTLF